MLEATRAGQRDKLQVWVAGLASSQNEDHAQRVLTRIKDRK